MQSRLEPVLKYREELLRQAEVAMEKSRAQLEAARKALMDLERHQSSGLDSLDCRTDFPVGWRSICYSFLTSLADRLCLERNRMDEARKTFEARRSEWEAAAREMNKIVLLVEAETRNLRRAHQALEERRLDDAETVRWIRSRPEPGLSRRTP
jgi:flagellar export protein FliJ